MDDQLFSYDPNEDELSRRSMAFLELLIKSLEVRPPTDDKRYEEMRKQAEEQLRYLEKRIAFMRERFNSLSVRNSDA